MLSSVPEVPLAACTRAVSPVVTAVPRADGHAEQAWPCSGWVRHGPGLAVPGLGQPRAALGRARAGPATGRTDLEGAAQEPCRAGQGRNGLSMGDAMGAFIGRVTLLGNAGQNGQRLGRAEASRADRAIRARTGRRGKPGHGTNGPIQAQGEPESTGQPAPKLADTAAGPSTPTGRAMPVASRTGTTPGSMAAAESPSRYPGARRSGVDRQSNSPDRRNCATVASSGAPHLTGHQGDKSLASESLWV
jgi:hypothetical protein